MENQNSFSKGAQIADRYQVQKLLGQGGMGDVYLVRDKVLNGELVALKVLHRHLARDEKQVKRFLREVQLARKVTHPNVLRTYDFGTSEGVPYFTMEYVEGEALKDKLTGSPLPINEACEYLSQIAKGLHAIHDAGIIHRDLKPANIIVLPGGEIKTADFGIARAGGGSELTGDAEIIGSAPYMAPEMWTGREITPAVDIYALGCLAYEMVTGIAPFDGDTPQELMFKHLEVAPVPPIEICSSVPVWLSKLIMEMLAKNPNSRPERCNDVATRAAAGFDWVGQVDSEIEIENPFCAQTTIPEGDSFAISTPAQHQPIVEFRPEPMSFERLSTTIVQSRNNTISVAYKIIGAFFMCIAASSIARLVVAPLWEEAGYTNATPLFRCVAVVALFASIALFQSVPVFLILLRSSFEAALRGACWMILVSTILGLLLLTFMFFQFGISPIDGFLSIANGKGRGVCELVAMQLLDIGMLAPNTVTGALSDVGGLVVHKKGYIQSLMPHLVYTLMWGVYLSTLLSQISKAVGSQNERISFYGSSAMAAIPIGITFFVMVVSPVLLATVSTPEFFLGVGPVRWSITPWYLFGVIFCWGYLFMNSRASDK